MGGESRVVIRRDRNAVALFDRRDGTKIRFAIGSYNKSRIPELCDVKITDYCAYGCTFCYQGSTLNGEHASMENMERIIAEMSKHCVFEVAYGGGETTDHPHFSDIIRKTYESGVVPNFTTKYPGKVRKHWDSIKDYIGGFAYSAETPGQIYAAAKTFERGGIPASKVSLHCVMGLTRRGQFREYLEAASEVGYRVTLLGYKTTGRGKDVIPFPYDWWIEEVSDLVKSGDSPSLSIDTPMSAQYSGRMPIADYMHFSREGAFSMYIDAVQMKMGASSFDASAELVPFDACWVRRYRSL